MFRELDSEGQYMNHFFIFIIQEVLKAYIQFEGI